MEKRNDQSPLIGYLFLVCLGLLVGLGAYFGWATLLTVLVGGAAVVLSIAVLYYTAKRRRAWRRFLREAPGQIQTLMATVRAGLLACGHCLEMAERELEAATAPLFWDAMDDFEPAIMRCRDVWNEAVDIADRYTRVSARLPRFEEAVAITPDASLPATIAEIGEKWMGLRRRALGNEHFASIFEQRRQADKIADRLKRQGEDIQTAIDGARRAELTASDAAAVAAGAAATAKKADTRSRRAAAAARRAGTAASRASAAAGRAGATADSASAEVGRAVSIASWSKI